MKKIYLDYAASTPVDPHVKAAMEPYFSKVFGNAGSLHSFGQEASAAIFKAKETIARAISASYRDIIFTGSATEANNLALRGAMKALFHQRITNPIRINESFGKLKMVSRTESFVNSKKIRNSLIRPRIIISAIEHESVLETCRDMEKDGVNVVYIPVSREGIVDLKKLKAALNDKTILVSIMHANNEIGTIQPIAEIAKIIRDFRNKAPNYSITQLLNYPLFHTDAVQSFQYLDCNVQDLGVDLMTLSAHKIYGPKGIGALYMRQVSSDRRQVSSTKLHAPSIMTHDTWNLMPIITGGSQQRGIRPGTENTPLAVGFAKAVELTVAMREKESKRVKQLRDYFWKNLKKKLPTIVLNGSAAKRLPNNLNIYFPGDTAQDLLIKLDLAGIAVSPGAACLAHTAQSSYVLEALGWPLKRSSGSLRFSFGRQTTKPELNQTIDKIAKSVLQLL